MVSAYYHSGGFGFAQPPLEFLRCMSGAEFGCLSVVEDTHKTPKTVNTPC